MARRSKQTFRKRQREMAKKRKKEAKAGRLAARRAGNTLDESAVTAPESDEQPEGGPRVLKVRLARSGRNE